MTTIADFLDIHHITRAIVGVVGNEGYIADIPKDRFNTIKIGDVIYEGSHTFELESKQLEESYNKKVWVSIQILHVFVGR